MSRDVDPNAGFTPQVIRDIANDLRKATGHEPEIERPGDRRFRLVMRNDRVRMTLDYKMTNPGRWRLANSTLEVDGQQRPIAEGFDHFVKIFLDPDSAEQPYVPDPVQPEPLPEARPIEEAPDGVRRFYESIAGRASDTQKIHLGGDAERWVVGITTERVSFQLYFVCRGQEWKPAGRRPFQLIVDGVDRTAEMKGNVEKALALLSDHPTSAAPPLTGRPRQAARNTGVDVRKQTVMRI